MINILIVLILSLFFSDAAYAVTTNPLDNTIAQAKQGGIGMNTDCGLLSSSADNSTAANAWITANAATATTNNSTMGFAPCLLLNQTFAATNTITGRPYFKFFGGGTTFDFTGLSTSGTGFRIHSQDAPPSNGPGGAGVNVAAADMSPFLNGAYGGIYINGPGRYTQKTTLNGSIAKTDTSVVVNDASALAIGNDLNIDHEEITITGITSNTLTVTRGSYGSLTAAHSNAAAVNLINTSRGLDIGDQLTTPATGQYDVREAAIAGTTWGRWGTAIYVRNTNTYLMDFQYGGKVFSSAFGLQTANESGANSGENDRFSGWTFGGGVTGYLSGSAAVDMTIRNSSFDFYDGSCVFFQGLADFQTTYLLNDHFEHCDGGIADSSIATNSGNDVYVIDGLYVAANDLARGYAPFQAIFKHKMRVFIDRFKINYNNYWNDGTVGLFMVDAVTPTVVGAINNIIYAPFSYFQLTALSEVVNEDPFFVRCTAAGDPNTGACPNWTVVTKSGISALVDTTNTNGGNYGVSSPQVLAYTYTAPANFYEIASNPFRVRAGQEYLADITFNGGSSAGLDNMALQYHCYSSSGNIPAVTESGTQVSMTFFYSENLDPAWVSGNLRNYTGKLNTLDKYIIPQGYDTCQLYVTFSGLASGALISGSITNAGSGYTDGTYTNISLTGGTGSGAKATVTVAGGVVTSVSLAGLAPGTGYVNGDVLSATITGGSNFAYTVGSVGGVDTVYLSAAAVTPLKK